MPVLLVCCRGTPARDPLGSGSADLLRVVARDGALVPDPRRRLPGRGASLHPTPECLHAAERRRAFPRALHLPGGGGPPVEVGPLREHVLGAPPAPPGSGSRAGEHARTTTATTQTDRQPAGPQSSQDVVG